MTGSKGKSHERFSTDEEKESEGASTNEATNNPEEDKPSRRSASPSSSSTTTILGGGRDGSLTSVGQHNATTTTASQPNGAATAAVVPAVGGGSSLEQHKVEEQQTLRQQLETLVSHKLRTLGDLDHAGLAALEALNKLPAAPSHHPPAIDGGMKKKILPLGLEKIRKFSGKDPHYLTDCLNQFYSLVVAALPASSPSSVNKALTRDVVFVLEGSALKFFNSLKAGHVEWEATAPVSAEVAQGGTSSHQPQPYLQEEEDGLGGKRFRPPSTWTELYEAFHDHYLPVTGIARTSEKLFSSTQAPNESVLSLAQRQLGLATHLHRLIEANGNQINFMEAISIRLFERALRTDLRRIHDAEPPCSSFQESVDRAEFIAIKLAKKPDSTIAQDDNGGSGASSGPVAVPAVRSAVTSSQDGGDAGAFCGAPHHDDSERDDREERSSTTAPQGRNAASTGRDSGHESGEKRPPADGSQSTPTWHKQLGRGEGEALGNEKRRKKARKSQKRTRDWPDTHHGGGAGGGADVPAGGANQPFQPPQRSRSVDPGDSPPCTLSECKTINRNFHSSNDCFYHPIHGERNKARGNFGRKKGCRRSQPDHRGPQHHNNGFAGQ